MTARVWDRAVGSVKARPLFALVLHSRYGTDVVGAFSNLTDLHVHLESYVAESWLEESQRVTWDGPKTMPVSPSSAVRVFFEHSDESFDIVTLSNPYTA